MAALEGRLGRESDRQTRPGCQTSGHRPGTSTSSLNVTFRVDQEIPRNGEQEDDATEAVERGIDQLEKLVRDLRMASDALSTERLHRLKVK